MKVREYVIAGSDSFIPLILELDLSSLRNRETWLDTELACLIPLRPNVAMSIASLKERPEPGRAACEFYDANYVEPRYHGKYIGRYRKITASESLTEQPGKADCQLVVAGGPQLHGIGTFDRFATSTGWSRRHPEARFLQYAVVRNICEVKGRWDGLSVRDISADMPAYVEQLRRDWTKLYGASAIASIELTLDYVLVLSHRAEPYFGIMPWVFAVTPPGWSCLLDSFHLEGLDGLRALISTDSFFEVPPLWQFYKPARFSIPRGANLARALPVPRRLLRATFAEVSLDRARPDEIHHDPIG